MKRVDLFFIGVLLPLDFLVLIGSAAVAYSIRFSPIFAKLRPVTFDLPFGVFMNAVIPLSLLGLAIFAAAGLYAVRPARIAVETSRVILATAAGIALILAIAFFQRELFDSRFIVLAVWVLATVFVVVERLLVRLIQRSLRKFGIGVRHVIIIGKTKSGNSLKAFFDHYPKFGFAVTLQTAEFSDTARHNILALKHRDKADVILVANPDISAESLRQIKTFSDIEQLQFIYSAELFPGSSTRPIFHTFAGQPIIEVPKTPLDGWGAIYKRIFDIVISLLLILLTLPIQIVTALLVMIESRGPILFFQKRVGQSGKSFTYFKFRSMVKDANKYRFDPEFVKKYGNMREGSPLFKLADDPRVTRIGRIIRKFSIDEIPEFYNVLFGNMSLVGPRPHMPEEVEKYKPFQKKVLTIKPGISGVAQISGRANLEFDEEVRLDMHYIQNWSPWLDLIILLKTPFAVFEKLD